MYATFIEFVIEVPKLLSFINMESRRLDDPRADRLLRIEYPARPVENTDAHISFGDELRDLVFSELDIVGSCQTEIKILYRQIWIYYRVLCSRCFLQAV